MKHISNIEIELIDIICTRTKGVNIEWELDYFNALHKLYTLDHPVILSDEYARAQLKFVAEELQIHFDTKYVNKRAEELINAR